MRIVSAGSLRASQDHSSHDSRSADPEGMGRWRALKLLVLLSSLVSLAGCDSFQSGSPPPTAWSGSTRPESFDPATTIVVGELENPDSASIRDRNIGEALTEALDRTIRRRIGLQTISDDRLVRSVRRAVEYSGRERQRLLEDIGETDPPARFIVIGRVTDFYHTRDLHKDVRPRTGFGRGNDAVVAIDYQIIDLESLRVIASDHVRGVARAPDTPSRQLYRGVSVGSVVFWDSPLGHAGADAVARAAARLRQVVGAADGSMRIVRRIGERRVVVGVGRNAGLRAGQTYYVVMQEGGATAPVIDPILRQPLMGRVTSVETRAAEIWLLGEAPPEVNLRQARLVAYLPDIAEAALVATAEPDAPDQE